MIYKWKSGSRVNLDPQAAGDELERLRIESGGALTPATVAQSARDESSVLHPAFEWDDEKAADAYRTGQAQYLIRSIEVVIDGAPSAEPTRAFVSVNVEDGREYISVIDAMADSNLRKQVLETALRELEAWQLRHAELTELANVFAAIDQARAA